MSNRTAKSKHTVVCALNVEQQLEIILSTNEKAIDKYRSTQIYSYLNKIYVF